MRCSIAAMSILCCSCLGVADERTLRDLEVGIASDERISVRVEGGLASIRSLEEGVHLWAGAPVLAIEIEAQAPSFRVRIENVLADAVLRGDAVIKLESQPFPTEKIWRVELPRAGAIRLELAPPDLASHEPWRFGLFADVQERIEDVGDIYARMNEDEAMRFVVMSGDLTERGTRAQLERFREKLKELRVPCFATLGNHELGTDDEIFRELYGRGNATFSFRGVRFTLIDSASATLAPLVYDWLDEWLVLGRGEFHVVSMHIPPLDPIGLRNGAFANRGEAKRLVATLAEGGVDLTIYGHVHSYYAFTNAGIPAFISGGGGAIPERLDGVDRHYLTVDVEPQTNAFQTALVRVD
jgi:3',5'-cyclic-AMP phosphodiesterase